jgi:hypothetical protein
MHKQMLIRLIKTAKDVMHSILWFCGMAVLILRCIMAALGKIDLFTPRRNDATWFLLGSLQEMVLTFD